MQHPAEFDHLCRAVARLATPRADDPDRCATRLIWAGTDSDQFVRRQLEPGQAVGRARALRPFTNFHPGFTLQ